MTFVLDRVNIVDMTIGISVCEEFSSDICVSTVVYKSESDAQAECEEIKCKLDISYLTALIERMAQIGYYCTQVQKDLRLDSCTVWFEPISIK